MTQDELSEMLYYKELGFLYVSDIRYDEHNRAFCNPLPDGRVQFRVHTEHSFQEVNLVYNDGEPRVAPLQRRGQDSRFLYWEVFVSPQRPQFRYSFALKHQARPTHPYIYWGGHGLTHVVESYFELDLTMIEPFVTPDWVKGAVVYQIFPERFASGNAQITPANAVSWGSEPAVYQFQGGDLHGIAQNIEYLADLGIEIIYLNPINVSLSNHKYDAVDFYHVDPAFGGDEALHELVAAAHSYNIKLILDASFNHCYPQFFAFKDLIDKGADSPYADWFTVYEWPVRVITRPHLLKSHPHRERFENWFDHFKATSGVPLEIATDEGPIVQPTYKAWYNVINMPQIKQTNPDTRRYFLDVAAYWLQEFDIDGWRMDVAQFIVDDFWVDFRRVCRAVKADCYLLAEIWGDTSHWLQGDMFDATMNYLFRDLCVAYFAQGVLSSVAMVEGLTRLEFLYAPQATAVNQNLLSSHDVPRFHHLSGEKEERFLLATLFALTMPGVPSIYYGDEIGMTGGHDPDNRRAFPWHDRPSWNTDLRETIKYLIGLRRTYPALRLGRWTAVWVGQSSDAFAYVREYEGQRVLVLINRAELLRPSYLPVPTTTMQILFGNAAIRLEETGLTVANMRPWSGLIIAISNE